MRFLPTVGRTMINEQFSNLTDGVKIESPLIWECTRFCLAPQAPSRVAAALMLGASGVQLGTAFLTTDEATVPAVYRDAISSATEEDTRMTRAFSGRPARGIRNRYLDAMVEVDDQLPDFPLMNTLTKPLRAASQKAGSGDMMSLWAGQALTLNRSMPAASLVETLVLETQAALDRHAG